MPIGGYNWTLPLLQQINRQGDLMLQGHALQQEGERNAMQKQLFGLQITEKLNALVGQNALKKALMGAGNSDDLESVARGLITQGRPEGLELLIKAQDLKSKGIVKIGAEESLYDTGKGKIISQGAGKTPSGEWSAAYFKTHGKYPTPEEVQSYMESKSRAGAQTINMPKITLERESGLVEQGIKDIKENKKDVLISRAAIDRIDQALNIVEKQGDKVAGVQGQIRRALAPFAKTIGMDVQAATDAQILDSLLTAGAGSLRSQVVGPGPVTNYEQEILQKVSGGKMSYADGIKAVLEEARNQHAGNIDRYNEQVETISGIKGYENIKGVFKPINYTKRQPKAQAATTGKKVVNEGTYNGRNVVQYDDGSIEYAD